MAASLAVFTSQMGATFINLHVEALLPGRTVAVVRSNEIPVGGFWRQSCDLFSLEQWSSRFSTRIARRVKVDVDGMRDAALTRFLRRHSVNVVLGEFLDQFVEFVPLLDRLQIPYVAQSHGNDASAAL